MSGKSFIDWFRSEDKDLELASIIKDEIWPNPLTFHLMNEGLFVDDDDDNDNDFLNNETTLEDEIAIAEALKSDED